jgi:hypothetical protein
MHHTTFCFLDASWHRVLCTSSLCSLQYLWRNHGCSLVHCLPLFPLQRMEGIEWWGRSKKCWTSTRTRPLRTGSRCRKEIWSQAGRRWRSWACPRSWPLGKILGLIIMFTLFVHELQLYLTTYIVHLVWLVTALVFMVDFYQLFYNIIFV